MPIFAMRIHCRSWPLRLEVASYHGSTESSGQVDFLDRKLPDVSGRCVLLIDDILDTGRTLAAVTEKLREMGAREVKTCVLLTKDKKRAQEVEADYSGNLKLQMNLSLATGSILTESIAICPTLVCLIPQ